MTIDQPTSFADAVEILRRKRLLPTALSSRELRELEASLKRRSVFSARMTQAQAVQTLKDAVDGMLDGRINLADAKLQLTEMYRDLGYDSEAGGFPEDEPGTVPPAERGSLRDLASKRRMELTLKTNYRAAVNEAFRERGMTDAARFTFPAWELVRIAGRGTPRGDWPDRWEAAGGEFFGGRMVAAKDSDVWQALGDGAGGYRDTLGNPFPPFAFGSGMGLREVRREEALTLGVISEDDDIAKVATPATLTADPGDLDDETLDWFEAELKREAKEGRILPSERLEAAGRDASEFISLGVRNRLARLLDVLSNDRAYKRDHLGRFSSDGGPLSKKQNLQRGEKGLQRALRKKIDVPRAMNLPGLGQVDFPYGTPGDPAKDYHGGYGVSHIAAKHGRDLRGLIEAMVKGKVSPDPTNPKKRFIEYQDGGRAWKVIVVKAARSTDRTPPQPTGDKRLLSTSERRRFFARARKRKSRSAWLLSGFSKEK